MVMSFSCCVWTVLKTRSLVISLEQLLRHSLHVLSWLQLSHQKVGDWYDTRFIRNFDSPQLTVPVCIEALESCVMVTQKAGDVSLLGGCLLTGQMEVSNLYRLQRTRSSHHLLPLLMSTASVWREIAMRQRQLGGAVATREVFAVVARELAQDDMVGPLITESADQFRRNYSQRENWSGSFAHVGTMAFSVSGKVLLFNFRTWFSD